MSRNIIITRSLSKGWHDGRQYRSWIETSQLDRFGLPKYKEVPDAAQAINERWLDWQLYLAERTRSRRTRATMRE